MVENLPKLLVIEDDIDITEMLASYFKGQGYEVLIANWGEDGIHLCQTELPDLVILDIRLPDIDGFEVAHRLRTNRRTEQIPIIFLTEKRERESRLKGLGLKADDYITKPFDMQELRLRVKNILHRSQQTSLTNPVTGLPEGNLMDERLAESLKQPRCGGLLVCVENVDRFREVYGFVASDDLIRAITIMLRDTLSVLNELDPFIGHVTATDLLVILPVQSIEPYKVRIQRWTSESLGFFYRDQDRLSGLFTGRELKINLVDVSLKHHAVDKISDWRTDLVNLCQGKR